MKRFTLSILIVGLISSVSMAYPTLDTVLHNSSNPALSPVGVSYVRLIDIDSDTDTSVATLLLESCSASRANINAFGIYDMYTGNTLEVFGGPDSPYDQVTLKFNLLAGTVENLHTSITANIGGYFGFYLDSAVSGLVYTDESLNSGTEMGLIYDTFGYDLYVGGSTSFRQANVVVAFEQNISGDFDYDDLVVGVTDVTPIPAPGAILLGSIGVGLVGWLRRRRAL